jgi:hypothetical protein
MVKQLVAESTGRREGVYPIVGERPRISIHTNDSLFVCATGTNNRSLRLIHSGLRSSRCHARIVRTRLQPDPLGIRHGNCLPYSWASVRPARCQDTKLRTRVPIRS